MRYLLIVLLFYSCSLFSQEKLTQEDVRFIKSLAQGLNVEPDFFRKLIFVETDYISFMNQAGRTPSLLGEGRSTNQHKFYFVVSKTTDSSYSVGPLRYEINHNASSWLFIEKVIVMTCASNKDARKNIGNLFEIPIGKTDRTVSTGRIHETGQVVNEPEVEKWLEEVWNSGHLSKIRIYGEREYTEDILRGVDLQSSAASILLARKNIANSKK